MRQTKNKDFASNSILIKEICPVCKKVFYRGSQWGYKKKYKGKVQNVCSWSCLRNKRK